MSSTEVRTCPKCTQQAVTLVFTWQHTMYGASTGEVTREFRCQSCGAKFTVRSFSRNLGLWVAGGLLTIMVFTAWIGVPLLVLAWMRTGVEKRIPIAPGAPMPQIRYRGGPPLRTCGKCQRPLAAVKITRNSHNGIPTGTEYDYACSCGNRFTIESPLGTMLNFFFASLVAGGTVLCLTVAKSPGWRFGGGLGLALVTALFGWMAIGRTLARFKNPVLRETMLAPY